MDRVDVPELMDSGDVSPEELLGALRTLELLNRRFGGYRVILDRLEEWTQSRPPGSELSILDVGTGWADLPRELLRWGQSKGHRMRVVGLEPTPVIAELARRHTEGMPQIEIVEEYLDAFLLRGTRFDFVVTSLVLHHVPPAAQAAFLRSCDAAALRGVIVSDLNRTLPAWFAVTLATKLFGERISRHDGPISVRRSLTEAEARELADAAGLSYLQARRHPFFRLSLSGLKDGSSGNGE